MADIPTASALALQSRVSIPFGKLRLWAGTTQPAAPVGWLVLTRLPGDRLERYVSSEMARQALEAGWATLVLEATTANIARAAEYRHL